MANIEPSNATLQIRYKKGDKLDQIILERTKKDHVRNAEAGRRLILENPVLKQENKELKSKLRYVEDYASGKKEELYKKVRGFDFHNKCYDMLLVEGNPNARECICPPPPVRPVPIPKDKKTGTYIVRDPRICGRCLALGCRKIKENSKPKPNNQRESRRVFCKRDGVWIDYGEKDCLSCTWTASECSVKRRISRELRH